MLSVKDIVTAYAGIHALRGVSLEVPAGSMVALIGPNGAGKTTLLNTISGFLRPRQGEILFDGASIVGMAPYRVARLGLQHVPEGRQILGPLSVQENLEVGRLALGDRSAQGPLDLEEIYALFPILKEKCSHTGGSLSGGQQQMLAIGRALVSRPRLLLLDEPSLGLAPIVVSQVFRALSTLRAQGITILLVEQNAKRALEHSDYAYVLEQGRIALQGPSREMAADPRIVTYYLGGDATPQPAGSSAQLH